MEGALTRRLDAALLWGAALAPVGCAVVAAFVFYETASWGSVRYFMIYAAPLLVAVALWGRARLQVVETLTPLTLAMDGVVVALSFVRFVFGEVHPLSGHMLFLTYSVITTRATGYRWLAVILLLETTVFKLLIWRDPYSWTLGLLAGLVMAVIVWLAGGRAGRAGFAPPRASRARDDQP